MDHLTIDQIIDFVSMDALTEQTLALAASVNGHIRKCPQCLQLVRAFQMIYDEFSVLARSGDFRRYLALPGVREKLLAELPQDTDDLFWLTEDGGL